MCVGEGWLVEAFALLLFQPLNVSIGHLEINMRVVWLCVVCVKERGDKLVFCCVCVGE